MKNPIRYQLNKDQTFGKTINKTSPISTRRLALTLVAGVLCLTASSTKINAFGSTPSKVDVENSGVKSPDNSYLTSTIGLASASTMLRSAGTISPAMREEILSERSTPVTGLSGRLRSFLTTTGEGPEIVKAYLARPDSASPKFFDFHFITLIPHSEKKNGRIGNYRIGQWPKLGNRGSSSASNGTPGKVSYDPPTGFIEVTQLNQNTPLSEAFTIKDFLTKGQVSVWPKYVYVNLNLVDKLELILADLETRGINTSGVTVMSGFRTPEYNASGGDPRGRASLSRHMYGDAADIYIDSDGDGRMDDLNKDGRVDIKDAHVLAAAADRVEALYPSLVGGVGVYKANSSHGPFVHIDTRGTRARW